jgi:hypothetical protein
LAKAEVGRVSFLHESSGFALTVCERPPWHAFCARKPFVNGSRTSGSADHRRSRRQAVDRLVKGQLVSSGAPVKICDISPGGFAIETSSPVRTGDVLAVRFTSRGGSSFIVRATATHSRSVSRSTGPACYLVGLEFAAQQTPTGQQAIKGLLQAVNQILSFPKSLSG